MFRRWVSTRAGRLRVVSSEAKVLRHYIVGADLYICPGVTSHAESGATHSPAPTLDNAGLFLLERLKWRLPPPSSIPTPWREITL